MLRCCWSDRVFVLAIVLVSVLLQQSSVLYSSSAFTTPPYRIIIDLQQNLRSESFSVVNYFKGSGDNGDEEDDLYEDDEPTIKPYRNRSLAWTLRYRKLNPYDKVRTRVIGFGHRSKEDWDEAVSSGQLGQYVPSYPNEMYAPEWQSWEEWLGLMRSYNDTKNLATNILALKSLDDYLLFVKSNPKRAEGLRIPVRPDIFYKDEWIDEESFFGKL